jgi:protein-tyrosine-phosphatase
LARTVMFVCLHGAGKSRIAAALFDAAATGGWRAVSAGLEPQEQVSEHAAALLQADPAAALLDCDPPRPVTGMAADLVVAIDCEIPGVRRWDLVESWPGQPVCDELRGLTEALAGELSSSPE